MWYRNGNIQKRGGGDMEVDTKWTWGHIQHIQNTHTETCKHFYWISNATSFDVISLRVKKAQKLRDRIVTIWMTCTNTQKKGRRRSKKGQRKQQKTNVYTYRYMWRRCVVASRKPTEWLLKRATPHVDQCGHQLASANTLKEIGCQTYWRTRHMHLWLET